MFFSFTAQKEVDGWDPIPGRERHFATPPTLALRPCYGQYRCTSVGLTTNLKLVARFWNMVFINSVQNLFPVPLINSTVYPKRILFTVV